MCVAAVPPIPPAVRVPSVRSGRGRIAAIAGLILVGLTLLGFGIGLWLSGGEAGPSNIEKTSTTRITKPPKAEARGGTTTTAVESTEKSAPGEPAERSEAIVAAALGLGSILFLCGIFFGRIQEVTLPGGAGFKLGPAAQAKLAEKVTATAKARDDLSDDPETIAALYRAALDELAQRPPTLPAEAPVIEESGVYYAAPPVEVAPGDDYLDGVVAEAAERVSG